MASYALVIAITTFLAGAATAVFIMLVVGIRKADHRHRGQVSRSTPTDAATRSILRANTWPNNPVVHGDGEER